MYMLHIVAIGDGCMALTKLCKCGAKILIGARSCERCRPVYNKAYDKHHRNKDSTSVYNDKRWTILTALCKARFNGIDVYHYYTTNQLIIGTLSHHIIEVTEDNTKAFDLENLIYLSDQSHQTIHSIYRKSLEEKKKLQCVLNEMVRRWQVEGI